MSSNGKELFSSLRMKALTEIPLSRKRKRQEINIVKLNSIEKEEPQAGVTNTIRRIVDVNLVFRELKNGCNKCKSHPLLLTDGI